MSQIKISIPEPCTQNWANMTATEKGRYCSSCAKEVIDFRNWTTDELQNWFASSKGNVCGHLSKGQLAYFKQEEPQHLSLGFGTKIFLASALALFASSKTYAHTKAVTKTAIYEDKNRIKSDAKRTEQVTDSLITISGVVKDQDDKLPVPGVSIQINNGQYKAMTDAEGKFKLQITARKGDEIFLTVRFIGYVTQNQRIIIGEKDQIEVNMCVSGEVLGLMIISKPSLPKRIWNFIKRPFVSRH